MRVDRYQGAKTYQTSEETTTLKEEGQKYCYIL